MPDLNCTNHYQGKHSEAGQLHSPEERLYSCPPGRLLWKLQCNFDLIGLIVDQRINASAANSSTSPNSII
jgi:hypothetical protein